MHEHHGQAHYAPASVGALADTAFLRRAAMDVNDEHRAERALPLVMRPGWIGAMRAFADALRRH